MPNVSLETRILGSIEDLSSPERSVRAISRAGSRNKVKEEEEGEEERPTKGRRVD